VRLATGLAAGKADGAVSAAVRPSAVRCRQPFETVIEAEAFDTSIEPVPTA
jgi:hypothetical protein